VRDFLVSILGEASWPEMALVGLFFVLVLGFNWAPRLGEAVGELLGGVEPDDS
jgi:hypothetical protein